MTQCRNEGDVEGSKCPQHSFVLTPLNMGLYFKRPVELNLCPLKLQNTDTLHSIIPHYLNDGKDYTPAFILSVEREDLEKNQGQLQNNLIERGRKEEVHSKEIQLPKPYAGRKYCYICRVPYADYLEHTNDRSHLHRIKTNRYRNLIAGLCRTFYPNQHTQKSKRARHSKAQREKQRVNFGKNVDQTPRSQVIKHEQKDVEELEVEELPMKAKIQRMPSIFNLDQDAYGENDSNAIIFTRRDSRVFGGSY